DSNIIVIDYNWNLRLLKQRLIRVDTKRKQAECVLQRNYVMTLAPELNITAFTGTTTAVIGPCDDQAYIFPVDPLSPTPHRDISSLIRSAERHAERHYTPR
ncbi:hypothetical protein PMAYCL1PPCAC_31449, partial [Pristionchus mayeri]